MNDEIIIESNDSGFFSNCNIILTRIIQYFNNYGILPNKLITNNAFTIYQTYHREDIYNLIFCPSITTDIKIYKQIKFNNENFENQFSDYKLLNLKDIYPFIHKYFTLNDIIKENSISLLNNYDINVNEVCGIFYRGNDKVKETCKPPYNEFILKAKEIKEKNNNIKFLLQTDEFEFFIHFMKAFPDTKYFKEVPPIKTTNSTNISKLLYTENKRKHIINFVSIIYIFSKLPYLITTSGNCELFIIFYRNHTNNLFQYLKKNKYIHGNINPEYDENNKLYNLNTKINIINYSKRIIYIVDKMNNIMTKNSNNEFYIWPSSIHSIILFMFGLNYQLLTGILDNSPNKIGKYLYAYNLKCYSFQEIYTNKNNKNTCIFIGGAGNYMNEIKLNNENIQIYKITDF